MKNYAYRTMMVRDQPLQPARCGEPSASLPIIRKALENLDVHGKEHFGVLYLSVRHHVIGTEIISTGCLSASLVHPREVFRGAVALPCAALVLFHNHPSGDPEPSAEDLALTRRLQAAGAVLGIEIVDHVVVASGDPWKMVSLRERGMLVKN